MELCKCEYYHDRLKTFKDFNLGTMLPELPRRKVPKHAMIAPRMAGFDRPKRPHILQVKPQPPLKIFRQWIPVIPDLVAQKYVNERRTGRGSRIFP